MTVSRWTGSAWDYSPQRSADIEGKLRDSGHDPLQTQVVLREMERGTQINLQDDTEVFQESDPPIIEEVAADKTPTSNDEEEEVDVAALRAEINRLQCETKKIRHLRFGG